MAGDWIKMRSGIEQTPEFVSLCRRTNENAGQILMALYRAACWFQEHGDYGKLRQSSDLIDQYVGINGFSDALEAIGWLRQEDGAALLQHFTGVSGSRKSLGAKVRWQVLGIGKCSACGCTEDLEIDHKTPVSRGGSCALENLQALCRTCNRKKGRKTMEEFAPC